MIEIRFQKPVETTAETSTNEKSAAIKLFESRDLEDEFGHAKKYEMGQIRDSQTHTKKKLA